MSDLESRWKVTQRAMHAHGVYDGAIDGLPGDLTREGVELLIGQQETTPGVPVPSQRWSYGGKSIKPGVLRDPAQLDPVFADKVDTLFRAMRSAGYDPYLWEALRSFERAEQLAKNKRGIALSMHCYGLAVDIVDGDDSPWSGPPGFFESLHHEAHALGLHTIGAQDRPHIQAVPIGPMQDRVRAMTESERRALIAERLA